jgi:hypothetical protein
MGWDDGPRMEEPRDAPESRMGQRTRGGLIPPVFWVAFILFDLVVLGAVLFFVLAR